MSILMQLFRVLADIDECATGQHACHENAVCTNVAGSHQCQCKPGYEGDGHQCERKWLRCQLGPC